VTVRIATYNIHGAVGSDGRPDRGRIIRVVQELNVQVLALQEVSYRPHERGHFLGALGAAMGAEVIEGTTLHDERGHYGNALLSRLPILEVRRFDISVPGREPRGAIEGLLALDGNALQVVATHLGLRPMERRLQIRQLLALLEAPSSACTKVLMGDLNEWFLWGRPNRWLERVFKPTPAPATFPARRPLLALDRLWALPRASIRRIYTHRSELARRASDHLPLVAELECRGCDE
jgi:endonuclease/exonuclease/phosphatase family metal-dependent hydrolase